MTSSLFTRGALDCDTELLGRKICTIAIVKHHLAAQLTSSVMPEAVIGSEESHIAKLARHSRVAMLGDGLAN